ncbi:MAG: hypothetical protein ACLQLC_06835 [Candidatus Sulfotelmatobacter sp.]
MVEERHGWFVVATAVIVPLATGQRHDRNIETASYKSLTNAIT